MSREVVLAAVRVLQLLFFLRDPNPADLKQVERVPAHRNTISLRLSSWPHAATVDLPLSLGVCPQAP